MKYTRRYSYKDFGYETVYIYQNPVKNGTLTGQTAPKIKVL